MQTIKLFILVLLFMVILSPKAFSATDTVFFDDFETFQGWIRNYFGYDDAYYGMWERDNPQQTIYGVIMQLGTTVSGENGLCTGHYAGNVAGSYDIDGGKTSVRSPDITLPADGDITLSFSYYLAHYNNATSNDYLRVKVIGSTTHLVFEELGSSDVDEGVWATFSTSLNAFAGQTINILIEAADEAEVSLVEAGIDDVLIVSDIPGGEAPDDHWILSGIDIENTNQGAVKVTDELIIGDNSTNEWAQFKPHSFSIHAGGDEYMTYMEGGLQFGGGGNQTTIYPNEINTSLIGTDEMKIVDELIIGDNTTNEWAIFKPHSFSIHAGGDEYMTYMDGAFQFGNGVNQTTIYPNEINTSLFSADEARIDGELWARKVTVTLDAFPDHVFSDSYKLKSLSEIEEHIENNGTLPGMPSEKEVKKNGIDLGEMQTKLLEKIEEMTLHMISLEKKNKALEAKVNILEKKVESK